jgi:two-component system nitrogen regulation sensor histidine kinase NtrY
MLLDIQPEMRVAEATALRELMQVLSHEIMNALTPVASLAATAADLLSDETPASNAMARDAVETLARRAQGLSRFVEAYRRLARLPAPVLRPTSISALLSEVAQLFESQWPRELVRLTVIRPNPDIVAELDRDLLVHALMNILANGADAATACQGRIAQISLSAEARAVGVILKIEDNGPGVLSADRDRIFQPFFTTKAEGTGVGLSFARQVILSHGGALHLADNPPGGGASFELTLQRL